MERALYIRKFRNIGLNGKNEERIVLNYSLEKGKIGNLVILVGPNNSGKSNVLDALYEMGNLKIESRDVTTLSFETDDRKPQLSLQCKDNENVWSQTLTYGSDKCFYKYPQKKLDPVFTFTQDLTNLKDTLISIRNIFTSYNRSFQYYGISTIYDNTINKIGDKSSDPSDIEKLVVSFINEIITKYPNIWQNIKNTLINSILITESIKYFEKNINYEVELNESFKKKFGYNFFPKIIRYNEEKIDNSMLKSEPNSIDKNKIFLNIFKKLGVETDEIKNVYLTFNETSNRGVLTTLQNKLNKKLKAVSDDFNQLYFTKSESYSFEFTLESANIFFEIRHGDKDLSLNYQSTGFKWFFNLYFNLLCNNTLTTGDILIMDEPATNLHVLGQKELRKFLKDFAINNDIVIIIATHSPFLINMNYLDELRIITSKNNKTSIINDFSTIDPDDPDSLKPIKLSLTISNHVLYDPDNTVIFVEGITDYNYLLAMKERLNIKENIIFLPIKGVGDYSSPAFKEKQESISKELITIKKHNPILLVDSDRPGLSIKKINNENSNLRVISLKDIDLKFHEIENVFSTQDLTKYNLGEKSSGKSSLVKNYPDEFKFDEETLNNFKKIFDYIKNI